ncbi:PepSY-associated TM helix domain-containing protein [Nostoc sp.]|uniref:PepSY-associated TM helix domain-containing protein n=1 Tax=Nostoc sp. TaxID=1180 RepID=UPI002FFA3D06
MALRQHSDTHRFFEIAYLLHYALLGGDIAYKFVGIIGLLMSFMSITGMILWSGWRRLISGFKIKWNAHPKRVNFDNKILDKTLKKRAFQSQDILQN